MKLSFSTHGWEDISWNAHRDIAADMKFNGVEYAYSEHEITQMLYSARAAEHRQHFYRKMNELNLEIPCLSADIVLDTADAGMLQRVEECIQLAGLLNIPYVHLISDITAEGDENVIREAVANVLPLAEKENVVLLMETCGIYANTARLRDLLNHFASDNLAALWDVHHPFRFAKETPEQTIQNLGAYVKHVHMRDSKVENKTVAYCLTGDGDVPFTEIFGALRSIDYKGYFSLVWPKINNTFLHDEQIVFPHYVNFMERFGPQVRKVSSLYQNRSKTGYHIWPKDELIDCTFAQVLDRCVKEFPDQLAFRFTTLDYTRTYEEFRDDVNEFARALIALGVKAGDHVAMWATNVPQWYIAFWATVKLGAVLVTMNTAYKIAEAEYLLRQSDTHTLIMVDGYRDSNYVEIMQTLCPELAEADANKALHCKRLPFLRHIITINSRQKGCLTWDDALEFSSRVPLEEVNRRAARVHPDDVCNMQYTSGTTGFPKGVMLTHRNIVNNGKCIGDRMDLSTADRMMIQVPMFHCFGMVLAMTAAMTHSVTLSPLPYFSPKPALACIKQERITCFHGVPTMFIAMLEHEDFNSDDFTYMRTGIMAGSPCPISVMRDVLEKMHMSEITIVYGQTEASPGCTMSSTNDPIDVRVATVGRPLPQIECKIVDPETGEDLPDGMDGEFVARGYNIMKGYYKMPNATAAAIDKDGWLHTGDLACRTPEGNFRITGRLKDMIIRGGENIYPKEIEEFIYTHPQVKDVQVIGVPSAQYGEEIMACVILKEGQSMSEQDIKDYVAANMAKHKVPRYVQFMTEFPMNAAGKILKYKMREDAVKLLKLEADAAIETA